MKSIALAEVLISEGARASWGEELVQARGALHGRFCYWIGGRCVALAWVAEAAAIRHRRAALSRRRTSPWSEW
jgi:xanthine/CO dehydrogenase XdhC/CoxF family maturation factor